MKSNFGLGLIVVLGMLLYLDSASAAPKSRSRRWPAARKSSARRMPFGPMPPANRRFTPAKMAKRNTMPMKRDQFSLSTLLGIPTTDYGYYSQSPYLDSSTAPTTLDDAFKMGYQAGKAVAIGDTIRNQFAQYSSTGSYASPGSYAAGTTTYNLYFPGNAQYQPSNLGYFDPTFSFVQPPVTTDPGFGLYDPSAYTPQVNEDDDFLTMPAYIDPTLTYPDPSYTYIGDDLLGSVPLDNPVLTQDNMVVSTDPVLISPDGTITPVVLDSTGNVLVPVGTLDATSPDLLVSNVLSN